MTGSVIQRVAWLPLRAVFSLFLRLEIRGIENIREMNTQAIFACNHSHELDPLIVVACLPWRSKYLPLIFVSREKSFYAGLGWRKRIYGGLFFKLMGALQAYTGLHNYNKALVHHLEALNAGRSVCIFPMGKRHIDTNLHNAKGGVAFLGEKTSIPIIPVRITGIENMRLNDLFLRKRHLRVTFGKPVYFTELKADESNGFERSEYEAAATLLMQKIVKLDSGR